MFCRVVATFARMAENKPMIVHDDPSVTEVFCSRLISTVVEDGAIIATFGVLRFVPDRTHSVPPPDKQPALYVTARFALSDKAARSPLHSLNNLLNKPGSTVQ